VQGSIHAALLDGGIVWLALLCCLGVQQPRPGTPRLAHQAGGLGGALQEGRAIRRKLPCQPQAPLRPRSSSWSAQTEYSRLLTEQSHARAPGSKAWQQWLQVLLDRSKQDRVIDAEITADDAIPHSGHRRPWNVRIGRLQRLWQVPGRLAQNLISRITA
jgi:hypothetical protein